MMVLAIVVVGVTWLPTDTGKGSDRALVGALPEHVRQESVPVASSNRGGLQSTSVTTGECPPNFEVDLDFPYVATRFDTDRGVGELYVRNIPLDLIERYDVSADLTYSVLQIPVGSALPWIAEDLDRDGEVELVVQCYDEMRIHSAPDWRERARFVWPGTNVVLKPTTFQLDDDPYWEIYATPHVLFGGGLAAVIDYDPATDSFFIASELIAPNGVAGKSAIADFDEDGRVEFITGNNDFGYELFEWQGAALAYIGCVGDSIDGNNLGAVACSPKPGETRYALTGHSSATAGFQYQLLKAVSDNDFEVDHVFQEHTGFTGPPVLAAVDTDCDGLDELAMGFYPTYGSWEWDTVSATFVPVCGWTADSVASLLDWYPVDLDQDGRAEWGAINHLEIFRAFPSSGCFDCDSTGHCPLPSLICNCSCFADPVCDTVPNVLDIVTAVDVAFRGGSATADPLLVCPVSRTDVTCDSQTDVLDVVHLVNVIFRSGDPAIEFCDPCP